MPVYEYVYTTKAKIEKSAEQRHPISSAPSIIDVQDADGDWYRAKRIISRTANMKLNWDSYSPSDLPPINYPAS
jgi:hypothetical protein